ncbi:hypothetical protein L207DRAFT_168100 [Hyaloscypha variabilis F]|uniref:Uncharacterized protein n=1 Tax=Hyaloscypha variabilis (strain UAMH 11265 / GT02V1 / F) TaxID=1149755 RepID=A0A2J6R3Z0_HYAVF|nr:hypothetical protein L207DRAFT_168100 [Hyaloscypha variabilis F]
MPQCKKTSSWAFNRYLLQSNAKAFNTSMNTEISLYHSLQAVNENHSNKSISMGLYTAGSGKHTSKIHYSIQHASNASAPDYYANMGCCHFCFHEEHKRRLVDASCIVLAFVLPSFMLRRVQEAFLGGQVTCTCSHPRISLFLYRVEWLGLNYPRGRFQPFWACYTGL